MPEACALSKRLVWCVRGLSLDTINSATRYHDMPPPIAARGCQKYHPLRRSARETRTCLEARFRQQLVRATTIPAFVKVKPILGLMEA